MFFLVNSVPYLFWSTGPEEIVKIGLGEFLPVFCEFWSLKEIGPPKHVDQWTTTPGESTVSKQEVCQLDRLQAVLPLGGF